MKNNKSPQEVRGFHAVCGKSYTKDSSTLETTLAIAAIIVMITFVGLLLRALA